MISRFAVTIIFILCVCSATAARALPFSQLEDQANTAYDEGRDLLAYMVVEEMKGER